MRGSAMVRGALLLALALVLQSLRLVLPLPLLLSTFIIGALVHMMLTVTLRLNGKTAALLLGLLLPLTAYAQGQLALPLLIPVVWLGNSVFVLALSCLGRRRWLAPFLASGCKAAVMLCLAWIVLNFLQLENPAVRKAVLFAMSVPQLLTGIGGVLLAERLLPLLRSKI